MLSHLIKQKKFLILLTWYRCRVRACHNLVFSLQFVERGIECRHLTSVSFGDDPRAERERWQAIGYCVETSAWMKQLVFRVDTS